MPTPLIDSSALYDGQELGFPVHFQDKKAFLDSPRIHPIFYGLFHDTPFGPCWIGLWQNYIVALDFTQKPIHERPPHQQYSWLYDQKDEIQNSPKKINEVGQLIFNSPAMTAKEPWALLLIGTSFQHLVWSILCQLYKGQKISYKECAILLNKPKAARAVGRAVGCNPVSWLVPCHRIIGSNNQPGGFGWGLPMKEKMLAYEST